MGEVLDFPVPKALTPEQVDFWVDRLEIAERNREYAMRMLGLSAIGDEDGETWQT